MPNMFFAIQLAIEAIQAKGSKWVDRAEKGVISIEYGVLGFFIAVALVGSIQNIRDTVSDLLITIINAFP